MFMLRTGFGWNNAQPERVIHHCDKEIAMHIPGNSGVLLLVIAGMVLAAYAADQPKLQIESPQNGAKITSPPGAGNVVMIRFKTDDFKIVSLKDAMKDTSGTQSASAQSSTMNDTMSATNPSATPAGPALGGPTPTGGAKQEDLRSTGSTSDLPQSDQSASSAAASHSASNTRNDRGHIHVTLDNQTWFWIHSTTDPIVIAGIPDGPHTVKLELVGNNHAPTGVSQTVSFTVGTGSR
jgi:Family of unknown function (DUF6130)